MKIKNLLKSYDPHYMLCIDCGIHPIYEDGLRCEKCEYRKYIGVFSQVSMVEFELLIEENSNYADGSRSHGYQIKTLGQMR